MKSPLSRFLEPFAHLGGDPATEPARLERQALQMRRIENLLSPDVDALVALVMDNPRYRLETQRRKPHPSDAVDLLRGLPPPAMPQQKYFWGLWLEDEMIGHLEVLRRWPRAHYLYVGSLFIAERWQRQGYGHAAIEMLSSRTHGWPGIRRWRLAVVETQSSALAFWKQCGFSPTGQRHCLPDYPTPLLMMEKFISH